MALIQRQKSAEGGRAAPAPCSGGILESYPTLAEWLVLSHWPETGKARVTGTMMLFVEEGRWKAWLHDRDALEGCFVSGGNLNDLLAQVEGLLATGGGDWRPDKKGGRRGT